MEEKVNLFIRIFEWIEKKIVTPIGAGMVSFLVGGGVSYLVNSERIDTFKDRITELKKEIVEKQDDLNEREAENKFLRERLASADEDCANTFIIMSQAIEDIKKGTLQDKKNSERLAEQEKIENDNLNKINEKIKGKL